MARRRIWYGGGAIAATLTSATLATSCFAMSPVMTFGGGKSTEEAQHDNLVKITPPALVADAEWSGTVATAKIRVYADDDYRAQHVHWEQTFKEQLDYANEVLAADFGVRLEAEYRVWHQHVVSNRLEDTLAALAREDRGEDVLAVVGLTTSITLTKTFEHLGLASSPGRHLVIRGYADAEEHDVFERAFGKLSAQERASLYAARRRHQNASLFLHELAHNLGAPHRPETETIMSEIYSDHAAAFDPASRAIVLATLDERLHRAPRARPAPTTASSPTPTKHGAHPFLVILVDAAGHSTIGGQTVSDDTVDGLMRMSFDDDRETEIIVKAARTAPASVVTGVIDRAKAIGLQRVAVEAGD